MKFPCMREGQREEAGEEWRYNAIQWIGAMGAWYT